jgi:hypothetical protein
MFILDPPGSLMELTLAIMAHYEAVKITGMGPYHLSRGERGKKASAVETTHRTPFPGGEVRTGLGC